MSDRLCLSAFISATPTGQIFNFGDFYGKKICVERVQIWLKSDGRVWHLTRRPKCFILLAAEVCSVTMQRMHCCAFSIGYFVDSDV